MTETVVVLAILAAVQTVILVLLFLRKPPQQMDLAASLTNLGAQTERAEKGLRDELARNREDQSRTARDLREEVSTKMKEQADTGLKQIQVLGELTKSIETKLDSIRETNSRKLDEMRQTVDEKLQGTLEKRLGDSFKIVSDRLEQVHKGLGEMQTLATGVGDLKRVLTNVKTRGTWGEIQLRGILEQILLASQFEANVKVRPGSNDMVEFAVRLPGKDEAAVWLPIDSKFPKEDYERILDAQDNADADKLKSSRDGLARSLKLFAKTIRDLYIEPPHSTDFAILFLPTEGLFAEVCQYPGLLDAIQRDFRVTVAGPTTMATLLNSLQMGFQTLAIQKRSSEVAIVLNDVKNHFGKFGTLLEGVEKKLDEAKNKVADARKRSVTITRKLNKAGELPAEKSLLLSTQDEDAEADDESEELES